MSTFIHTISLEGLLNLRLKGSEKVLGRVLGKGSQKVLRREPAMGFTVKKRI